MENIDQKINIIVKDEQSLYSFFSPEDEFNESVKSYLRSKIRDEGDKHGVFLKVTAKVPMSEERFRAAVSKWIEDEDALFRREEKRTIYTLIALLIFGSVMLLATLQLEKTINVLQYSLMPIMGSLALSRSASIIVMDIPEIHAKKWLIQNMKERNVIQFEYNLEKGDQA